MSTDRDMDRTIRVTLIDTITGERFEGPSGWTAYWWSDGNGSCDCNRDVGSAAYLAAEPDPAAREFDDDPDGELFTCRRMRYLVASVEPMPEGYALGDFNKGYPEDLILEHIGPEGLRR